MEDKHPEPYKLKYIELGVCCRVVAALEPLSFRSLPLVLLTPAAPTGNEQYNPGYIEQVAAMEARANLLEIVFGPVAADDADTEDVPSKVVHGHPTRLTVDDARPMVADAPSAYV